MAALFTVARRWKEPKYPPTDEQRNKMWYTHTMEYYSGLKKEWRTDTCYKVVEPQNHYAQWKKPDTEGHIWWWFHFYEIFRIGKSIETVVRGWGGGGMQSNSLTSMVMENSGTRNGDGCTTLWIYVIRLNSTRLQLWVHLSLRLHQRCFNHIDSHSRSSGLAAH